MLKSLLCNVGLWQGAQLPVSTEMRMHGRSGASGAFSTDEYVQLTIGLLSHDSVVSHGASEVTFLELKTASENRVVLRAGL